METAATADHTRSQWRHHTLGLTFLLNTGADSDANIRYMIQPLERHLVEICRLSNLLLPVLLLSSQFPTSSQYSSASCIDTSSCVFHQTCQVNCDKESSCGTDWSYASRRLNHISSVLLQPAVVCVLVFCVSIHRRQLLSSPLDFLPRSAPCPPPLTPSAPKQLTPHTNTEHTSPGQHRWTECALTFTLGLQFTNSQSSLSRLTSWLRCDFLSTFCFRSPLMCRDLTRAATQRSPPQTTVSQSLLDALLITPITQAPALRLRKKKKRRSVSDLQLPKNKR